MTAIQRWTKFQIEIRSESGEKKDDIVREGDKNFCLR